MDTYLITGASSELGIEFIKKLEKKYEVKEEKCVVYAHYNENKKNLEILLKKMQWIELKLFQCDLSDFDSVEKMLDNIEKKFYPTHLLHLAAEKFAYMRIKDFDWNKAGKEFNIQVRSFIQICKRVLPQMANKEYGRVVVMLSAYTLGVPPKFMSDYIMEKYALLGFVKAAASEYAGKGVSINAISPNMMETKFLSNMDARLVEMNAKKSSMRRNINVSEVSKAIMYLYSDDASYVNGINFNMTGGDEM